MAVNEATKVIKYKMEFLLNIFGGEEMGERTLNVEGFTSVLSAGQRHMVTFYIALLM